MKVSYTSPGSTALIGLIWPEPYANSASLLLEDFMGHAIGRAQFDDTETWTYKQIYQNIYEEVRL